MKFTRDQISSIMHEDDVYQDGQLLFKVVESEIVDEDTEKGSTEHSYVIEEIKTGRFFSARLGKSSWWKQDEENAKAEWEEVFPKKITKVIYTNKKTS